MRIRWRGLELPSRVVPVREKLTDTYGEFHVEPFERGFGHTVGNSLRRILLSSLEGSAVTRIKIRGVDHEFSSIPGMVEDITDLVLNIKGLVVKNHSEANRTIPRRNPFENGYYARSVLTGKHDLYRLIGIRGLRASWSSYGIS